MPWANGAGETTELVSNSESTALTPGLVPWRLSIARLERPGPFSSLPGIARTFLPTAEVVLDIDGDVHRVPALTPQHFSGDQSVSLQELEQPCFAINLMNEDVGPPRGSMTLSLEHGESDRAEAVGRGELDRAGAVGRGPRLVLTLAPGLHVPRMTLLKLDEGEPLPERAPVVVLGPDPRSC